LLPVGIANADCTSAGDYGAGSGCAPPDSSSGSSKTESWPPTSVDWPPQLDSDAGNGGDKKDGGAKPTPIVMPNGQTPPPATPTPIVPVGSPAATTPGTSTTPTPIVSPHS
jgi:hypothetical protein